MRLPNRAGLQNTGAPMTKMKVRLEQNDIGSSPLLILTHLEQKENESRSRRAASSNFRHQATRQVLVQVHDALGADALRAMLLG